MQLRAKSENVSPTAYATGYLWHRHGLSHPALLIPEGRTIDRRFRFLIKLVRWLSGVSLDALMLSRHKGIDALLARAIESGQVTQVIELAAGLSPRGWRFKQRYGKKITYVETDLPHMADLKRRLLREGKLESPGHRVVSLNALAEAGPESLWEVAQTLDAKAGVAVISEGLLSYLDPDSAKAVWRRIAEALKFFPRGLYLSDAYLRPDNTSFSMKLFRGAIQRTVRGSMHVHFETLAGATETLRAAGFREAQLHDTRSIAEIQDVASVRGGDRVRILEART